MNIHGTIIMIMNKNAFTNFDIARVLGHHWIRRRVTSIEGFRGSGSDVTLLCKIWRFAFISMGRENGELSWDNAIFAQQTFTGRRRRLAPNLTLRGPLGFLFPL